MQIKNVKQTFLIFLSLVILSFSFYSYAEENSLTDKNIFLDSDQDGLSDEEEKIYGTDPHNSDTDGDSYSDGIEIKTGFDPLLPAPGDRIVKEEEEEEEEEKNTAVQTDSNSVTENENNLTEKFSERISQLAEEKKLSGSETELSSLTDTDEIISDIDIDEMQNVIEEIIEENVTADTLPEISLNDIKIKKQSYSKLSEEERNDRKKEDFSKYISSLFYIFSSNSPIPITSGKDINTALSSVQNNMLSAINSKKSSGLNDLEKSSEIILEEMKDVEVPAELADMHIKALSMLQYSKTVKNYIDPSNNDPIGDIVKLTKIDNFMNEFYVFSEEVSKKIDAYGISYDDDMKQRLKLQGVILPEEPSTVNNDDIFNILNEE